MKHAPVNGDTPQSIQPALIVLDWFSKRMDTNLGRNGLVVDMGRIEGNWKWSKCGVWNIKELIKLCIKPYEMCKAV